MFDDTGVFHIFSFVEHDTVFTEQLPFLDLIVENYPLLRCDAVELGG
jgi:hypothetical protein